MGFSRIEIISSKQGPNREYLAVQKSNNDVSFDKFESEFISKYPSKKVLMIPPEKDFEFAIKIFLISKLRKYYISVLWIGFLILFILEVGKSEIKKYGVKPNIDIETSLYLRKIADIGIPLISLSIMVYLIISVYRLLCTASIIKVRSTAIEKMK